MGPPGGKIYSQKHITIQSTTEKRKVTRKCFYNIQLKKEKKNANASTIYN